MAIDYRVVDITYSTAAELEAALDTEGVSDWTLLSAIPGPPNAETGDATITCIFRDPIP